MHTKHQPTTIQAPDTLAAVQIRFAAHIRDPDKQPPPADVEERRMAIYRELFFNNLSSLLAGTFPVMHELLTGSDWSRLVREFYRSGHNHTPFFPEIPRDFVYWLNNENPFPEKPYLPELAHYEWLELAVQIDTVPEPEHTPLPTDRQTWLHGSPKLSPWVRLGSYHYPVHRIRPGFEPEQSDQNGYFFLVYRDTRTETERVRFLALNPVSAWLYAQFKDNPGQSLQETLRRLAEQLGHKQPETLENSAQAVISDWHQRGIIVAYQ